MSTRYLFPALLSLYLLGCSTERTPQIVIPPSRDPALEPFVDKRATLRGTLHRIGKFGPFLVVGKTDVYMQPAHVGDIYRWSKIYDELDGREVEVTGVFRFRQYPVSDGPPRRGVAANVSHYWFEDETVEIRATDRPL